jgi:folate-binding protein YgfZ
MKLPPTFICDVSARGRLRFTGEDRVRFLNGQVTNDVKALKPGTGCYAAFTNAKGKMRSDASILSLNDCLLVDLEPNCSTRIAAELEKFLISDDVLIENLTESWQAYTVVGEKAIEALTKINLATQLPKQLFEISSLNESWGPGFIFRSRRSKQVSFDIWIEKSGAPNLFQKIKDSVTSVGGDVGDSTMLEILRIEAGIPRFGVEMDENTIPPEAGIETIAISYTKGCYIGQEVIARIKSVGHVNRSLARLKLPGGANAGSAIQFHEKEVGKLGSAIDSPTCGRIGLAIIRREAAAPGTTLSLSEGEASVVSDF